MRAGKYMGTNKYYRTSRKINSPINKLLKCTAFKKKDLPEHGKGNIVLQLISNLILNVLFYRIVLFKHKNKFSDTFMTFIPHPQTDTVFQLHCVQLIC